MLVELLGDALGAQDGRVVHTAGRTSPTPENSFRPWPSLKVTVLLVFCLSLPETGCDAVRSSADTERTGVSRVARWAHRGELQLGDEDGRTLWSSGTAQHIRQLNELRDMTIVRRAFENRIHHVGVLVTAA
ncbi:hypothetical protein [Streptomyces sp. NBC_01190]|uniref:hypothetical protein n=1 Tax=Streptomyces sp. NBC_01190 TaxID=2903767 RepID=UPI00386E7D5B|nr:hypothetical protein OG519_29880 [Streptomyces sp. NBC_01190]